MVPKRIRSLAAIALPSHFNPPPRHVMCSYNSIQGVPTCGSKGLLTTVLRDLWKWEGFVVVRSYVSY